MTWGVANFFVSLLSLVACITCTHKEVGAVLSIAIPTLLPIHVILPLSKGLCHFHLYPFTQATDSPGGLGTLAIPLPSALCLHSIVLLGTHQVTLVSTYALFFWRTSQDCWNQDVCYLHKSHSLLHCPCTSYRDQCTLYLYFQHHLTLCSSRQFLDIALGLILKL